MNQNCRNCKHARWPRNAAGAKQYNGWAACEAPLPSLDTLPASILNYWRSGDLRQIWEEPRPVASSNKDPVECALWAKEEKTRG